MLTAAAALLSITTIGGAAAGWLLLRHYADSLPDVERLTSGYDPPQVSHVYSADGVLLSSVFSERRTVVPLEDLARGTKLAFLAAEDASFYEHHGLDYAGVMRALWANFKAGRTIQGGSTITQQVVKNLLLDGSRTFERKVREVILARRLEGELSKDAIFALYLNHIYFGHGRYGIEEAARFYFGAAAADLRLDQAALLAGIAASPERYSPRRHPERARTRQRFVLDQMLDKGFVNPARHAELTQAPLELAEAEIPRSELAPEAAKLAQSRITKVQSARHTRDGVIVGTTIDSGLQQAGRSALRRALDAYDRRHGLRPPLRASTPLATLPLAALGGAAAPRRDQIVVGRVEARDDARQRLLVRLGSVLGVVRLDREERYNPEHLSASAFAEVGASVRVRVLGDPARPEPALALELGPEGALVALDVRSREVKALVGSYAGIAGALDRTRQTRRQPGSAFKPIVFAAALQARKLTPATVFSFGPEVPDPTGEVTARHINARSALAFSNNQVAEQVLLMAGPERVAKLGQALGIESVLGADLSLALGSYEVTPLELASAYATFAAAGTFLPPKIIGEVSVGGEELPEPRPSPVQVLEPAEAYLLTHLLGSVVSYGTGRSAQRLGRPIAAKTGTTNAVRDAWFVGYTPELVCAVWIGYDDGVPLGSEESGSKTAAPAFIDFMEAAHAGHPVLDFTRPSGLTSAVIDPPTGLLAQPGQTETRTEIFLAGSEPKDWSAPTQPELALSTVDEASASAPVAPEAGLATLPVTSQFSATPFVPPPVVIVPQPAAASAEGTNRVSVPNPLGGSAASPTTGWVRSAASAASAAEGSASPPW